MHPCRKEARISKGTSISPGMRFPSAHRTRMGGTRYRTRSCSSGSEEQQQCSSLCSNGVRAGLCCCSMMQSNRRNRRIKGGSKMLLFRYIPRTKTSSTMMHGPPILVSCVSCATSDYICSCCVRRIPYTHIQEYQSPSRWQPHVVALAVAPPPAATAAAIT